MKNNNNNITNNNVFEILYQSYCNNKNTIYYINSDCITQKEYFDFLLLHLKDTENEIFKEFFLFLEKKYFNKSFHEFKKNTNNLNTICFHFSKKISFLNQYNKKELINSLFKETIEKKVKDTIKYGDPDNLSYLTTLITYFFANNLKLKNFKENKIIYNFYFNNNKKEFKQFEKNNYFLNIIKHLDNHIKYKNIDENEFINKINELNNIYVQLYIELKDKKKYNDINHIENNEKIVKEINNYFSNLLEKTTFSNLLNQNFDFINKLELFINFKISIKKENIFNFYNAMLSNLMLSTSKRGLLEYLNKINFDLSILDDKTKNNLKNKCLENKFYFDTYFNSSYYIKFTENDFYKLVLTFKNDFLNIFSEKTKEDLIKANFLKATTAYQIKKILTLTISFELLNEVLGHQGNLKSSRFIKLINNFNQFKAKRSKELIKKNLKKTITNDNPGENSVIIKKVNKI